VIQILYPGSECWTCSISLLWSVLLCV